MDRLRPHLQMLARSIEDSPDVSLRSDEVGLKIWLLPPWYAADMADAHSQRVAWADALAVTFGAPRVICGGELRAHGTKGTGRSWAIGKGLIGMATHEFSEEGYHSVVHNDELRALAEMDPTEFAGLGDEYTKRRSQADIIALCNSYGTSVAVGLRDDPEHEAFGCVTADTPPNVELTKAEQDACGDLIVSSVPDFVDTIASWGRYHPRKAW